MPILAQRQRSLHRRNSLLSESLSREIPPHTIGQQVVEKHTGGGAVLQPAVTPGIDSLPLPRREVGDEASKLESIKERSFSGHFLRKLGQSWLGSFGLETEAEEESQNRLMENHGRVPRVSTWC